MLLKWMPWKYFLKSTAKTYDIIDPLTLLARLRGFSQPSEIQEPIELLRVRSNQLLLWQLKTPTIYRSTPIDAGIKFQDVDIFNCHSNNNQKKHLTSLKSY